jgi:hypothetical protein
MHHAKLFVQLEVQVQRKIVGNDLGPNLNKKH